MMKLLLAVAAAVALRMMLAWSLTRHKPGRTRSATTSAAASSAPIPLAKPTWPSAWAAGPAAPGGSRVLTRGRSPRRGQSGEAFGQRAEGRRREVRGRLINRAKTAGNASSNGG